MPVGGLRVAGFFFYTRGHLPLLSLTPARTCVLTASLPSPPTTTTVAAAAAAVAAAAIAANAVTIAGEVAHGALKPPRKKKKGR